MNKKEAYPRRLRVFLCYSSDDKQVVRDLYKRLVAAGVEPWLDEENLLPGKKWEIEILSTIKSSDVVLVCLSRSAINKNGYVQKEIKYAIYIANQYPDDAIFLIPVKLEECQTPNRLLKLQCVNWFDPDGYNRLIRALQVRANTLGLSLFDSTLHQTTRFLNQKTDIGKPLMSRKDCPTCGAPLTFKNASAKVGICEYCDSLVATSDRGLEYLGKVSDLVAVNNRPKADTLRNRKIKILFLAAEPIDIKYRIHLGKELREIENAIELSDRFELTSKWAVRTSDLQEALLRYEPDIVHFSGHGAKQGIILEDDDGNTQCVPKDALAELFSIFKRNIRLVVLNACSTKSQIEAFKQTIDFTIGMKTPVGDKTAIEFAAAFYRALAYGHSVEESFRLAINQLSLDGLAAKTPILFMRRGVNASTAFLAPPPTTLSLMESEKASSIKECSVGLWIHGWVKQVYDDLPTIELDWTEFFNRYLRRIPSQKIWDTRLFPELQQAKERLDIHKFIDFRGKLPLTAMLAIGATFPEVGGYTHSFLVEAPTRGKAALWRSDVAPSKRKFNIIMEKKRKRGQDVLIALSITGDAKREVLALYEQRPETFSAMVYAEPDSRPGGGALRSDRDAVALAIHAKELIRECKLEYQASQIHLVVYGPSAYCLFLGQRLNALGKIATYERAINGGYKRSAILQTG